MNILTLTLKRLLTVLAIAIPAVAQAVTVSLTAPAANKVYTAPATVTITASVSGTGVTSVDFYQGTTLIGSKTGSPYTLTWSSVPAASYSLTAQAKNSGGTVLATSAAVPILVNAPPTVTLDSPSANQILAKGSTVTLNATATDSDGTISKVAFYRGTTLIGTATTAPYTLPWSITQTAGSYSLTAKATDNNAAVTTSTAVTITVANPPTVSLSAPAANKIFAAPASVTITATAAVGSGTTATLTQVDFYQGTTLIGTSTTSPYTVTWNNVTQGNYSLTAKATDSLGFATTSAARAITVETPPTVNLTNPVPNQVLAKGTTITLAATAADSDGSITKVDFYRGTTLIGTSTTAPYTIPWSITQAAGSYSLTAKATDNNAIATTSTAVPVTVVVDVPPTISLTSPANAASFQAPATITLTATAADSDGTITKVEFYQGTTLIGTDTTVPYATTWSNVTAGSYTLTAKATDNKGVVTTSTPTTVSVTANSAPTINITSPTAGQSIKAPASITLTANATDPDNNLATVAFYQNGSLITTLTSAPYTYAWNNVAQGSYTLTAIATDTLGAQTTSAPISITLTPAQAALFFIQPDHLGTPRLITDEQNNPVWRSLPTTEPFGNTPPEEDPSATGNSFHFNLRHSGYYADQETQTFYAYYRDAYDPLGGRFRQSDPIGLGGGINSYAFVENVPTMYVDPFGLFHCVQGADCNLSPDTTQSMQCFDTCTGRDTAVTSGRGNRSRPNSSHARGEACDIGRGANSDLSRESTEQCTIQCFPQGYGQEEGNRNGGTHFHIQQHTVPGGTPGFSPGIRRYSP